jgi:hypothetical protein
VFENTVPVLWRIFGPKREEWEELHNFYTSPNNIRVIKSRRIRWIEHVACMGEMKSAENWKGRDRLYDLDIDRKIILDWILKK